MAAETSMDSWAGATRGAERLSIDIGCGVAKKRGAIGLDIRALDGVDHVVDFTRDRLPFADGSVSDVFSAHCFEHLPDPVHVLKEISRVSAHGARVEIWLPYGWHDDAFLWDHRTIWNEQWFMHICHTHAWHWQPVLGARWRLREIVFHVNRATALDLRLHGIGVGFALRHMKNVALEMGVVVEIDKRSPVPAVGAPTDPAPPRFYSYGRDGARRIPIGERRVDRLLRLRRRLLDMLG
jgi:SAM-dependent methyltransferase